MLAHTEGWSFVQAASLPETFFTVWSNVFDRAHLLPNETLLVHGGSSGIGTTAIQLAKAFHARSSLQQALKPNVNSAWNSALMPPLTTRTDFVEEINRLTDSKGVDVILDMIGGNYFQHNLKCMAFDARLVQIGNSKRR